MLKKGGVMYCIRLIAHLTIPRQRVAAAWLERRAINWIRAVDRKQSTACRPERGENVLDCRGSWIKYGERISCLPSYIEYCWVHLDTELREFVEKICRPRTEFRHQPRSTSVFRADQRGYCFLPECSFALLTTYLTPTGVSTVADADRKWLEQFASGRTSRPEVCPCWVLESSFVAWIDNRSFRQNRKLANSTSTRKYVDGSPAWTSQNACYPLRSVCRYRYRCFPAYFWVFVFLFVTLFLVRVLLCVCQIRRHELSENTFFLCTNWILSVWVYLLLV